MEKGTIAQHIQTIDFEIRYYRKNIRYDTPGFETTPLAAFSTFLRLVPHVKSIGLGDSWPKHTSSLKLLSYYRDITTLLSPIVNNERMGILAQYFPNLKQLKMEKYDSDPSLWINAPVVPRQLELIDLEEGFVMPQTNLIAANKTTLRSLSVRIDVAAELDYSTLPILQWLRLSRSPFDTSITSEECDCKCQQLWDSLCQSQSLQTLSFGDGSKMTNYDKSLLGCCWRQSPRPRKSIPTLKQIRLTFPFPLEQANILLSGPLASNFQHVSLESSWSQDEAPALEDANKIKLVELVCKEKGIGFSVDI